MPSISIFHFRLKRRFPKKNKKPTKNNNNNNNKQTNKKYFMWTNTFLNEKESLDVNTNFRKSTFGLHIPQCKSYSAISIKRLVFFGRLCCSFDTSASYEESVDFHNIFQPFPHFRFSVTTDLTELTRQDGGMKSHFRTSPEICLLRHADWVHSII